MKADIIRVSSTTSAPSLASSISKTAQEQVKEWDEVAIVLRAIGVKAVNEALKACAIARGLTATHGIDLAVIPGFDTTIGNDDTEISVVILRLFWLQP